MKGKKSYINLYFSTQVLLQSQKEIQTVRETTHREIADLKQSLASVKKENMIPLGFIYVQLPKEKAPSTIWSSMVWTDVTSDYAGLFFRAGGGDAAAFGSIQEDHTRNLVSVKSGVNFDLGNHCSHTPDKFTRIANSQVLCTASYGATNGVNAINFTLATGEVRPRNMAIRVWKRTG